jgi:hypothetical protein
MGLECVVLAGLRLMAKQFLPVFDGLSLMLTRLIFDEAIRRLNMYRTEEGLMLRALEHKNHICKIGRTA